MKAGLALPLVLLAALAACEKPRVEDSRTVRKLQAEKARAASGAPALSADDARLAELAASEDTPLADTPRPVPSPAPQVHVGGATVTLHAVVQGQSVRASKVVLTTSDAFLRLNLTLHNPGTTPAPINLESAVLQTPKGRHFTLAPDVQRAAGTKQLHLQLEPGADEEAVLYFEVARSVLSQPLVLALSDGSGAAVALNLP